MFQILVIDDDTAVQELLRRTLKKQGYEVTVASNGEDGVAQAQKLRPALIICDWIMPRLTGIDVCRRVKADPDLSTTQFFLLTSLGSIADRVKGLDAGADDFISKPIELNELQARVRAGLRLHQLSRDLKIAKQSLEAELAEAAEYVQSLLPDPMTEPFSIEAKFIPSRQLGGDCFDYNWLDADYLAIYLLDVAGHGLRAALPSVAVLNLLRSRTLPNIDYYKPSDVLRALNTTFQMSYQNDKYFTIWYGVYNRISRQLVYASAGHPPAVLISQSPASTAKIQRLKTPGMPVGMFPDAPYVDNCCDVEDLSTLYIFSDGVYEIHQPDGNIWGLDPFVDLLAAYNGASADQLELVLNYIQKLNAKAVFDDDWSLLKVNFG
ncbi:MULTISPECIES: PP2C family protein-serine/threonine phosphatase [Microcoleus]|uniref:PP2C family protein-serine/threonine phosphatase n=1 Tax=Microcoleus TaxID=44471 RepID=UPI00020D13D7|nr:response regulator receiver modulated serine phosphatase [Microcoleus vaginatus FGP-2]MBD1882812.1 SpoIIE family protein phosphatase [Microcoleus sp. FACHB-84]MBD2010237.1 SpoIIE family protein phosphatase [Microcoleus sp. FACHB-45]UNU21397.1 response regulator [Microcoleus vaginatus PCC 9802]